MSGQRVLLGATATITETMADGLGSTPSPQIMAVTATVTNSAGVELASRSADPTGNPNEFSIPIDTVMTSALDILTVTWGNASSGVLSITTLEVVGGFLFAIQDLRSIPALADASTYSTLALQNVRTSVEDAIEGELGYALVPRYGSGDFENGGSSYRLAPYLRTVRTVTDAGDDLTIADLGLRYDHTGFVTGYTFTGPVTFGFEHGMSAPEPRARMHALQLAKAWAINGPIDDRTTSLTSPETGFTSVLATPGMGGSIFGLPAVDQWIRSARLLAVA